MQYVSRGDTQLDWRDIKFFRHLYSHVLDDQKEIGTGTL